MYLLRPPLGARDRLARGTDAQRGILVAIQFPRVPSPGPSTVHGSAARPHMSGTIRPRKTRGSGRPAPPRGASKRRGNMARAQFPRGAPARGKAEESPVDNRFQTKPYGCTGGNVPCTRPSSRSNELSGRKPHNSSSNPANLYRISRSRLRGGISPVPLLSSSRPCLVSFKIQVFSLSLHHINF